ncbi:MAG: LicD family protein [Coriobacteriales bacterium]|jgi:lipopolysaccharide cholinephosphotransferase|nr:LicD family protein [Coriobacteriales bacterium]
MTDETRISIGLEELKSIELGILKAFDAFCKTHDLTYWIAYGTLIGAVRHKGFIPWDDDIDILMPYDHYRRLLNLLNAGERIGAHYRLDAWGIQGDIKAHTTIAKVYDIRTRVVYNKLRKSLHIDEGIWLDIFPLVGYPGNGIAQRFLCFKLDLYDKLAMMSTYRFGKGDSWLGTCKRLLSFIPARLMGYSYWLKKYDALVDACPPLSSTPTCFAPPYSKRCFRSESFANTVYLDFEDGQFAAPAGWDAFLTAEYGDWQQLPPEDQRYSLHDFEVFWRTEGRL